MTKISEINKTTINGVIDTSVDVVQNMENIANSAQSWITYDITTGKWSVVINKKEIGANYNFNDENVIGAVNVTTTPLDRLYNAVEVEYPDLDIQDSNSFVRAEMLPEDLKQNETENVLRLTYPLIHDQIQALHLGLTELKQSRLDIVVTFSVAYTAYGIRAGEVITLTNSTYGWTNKAFRILQVEEIDDQEGYILIQITAQEYSGTIYDHDLSRFTLSNSDGIFSLADIGPMATPTVTLTEIDQLPNVKIQSIFANYGAPVTGVEIHTYEVTDPDEIANWNNPLIYPDDQRNYTLATTKYSIEETYELGADFEHSLYDLQPGNWLIKIRPINALTKGPFTLPGALTVYDPNVGAGVADDVADAFAAAAGNLVVRAYSAQHLVSNLTMDTITPPNWSTPYLEPAPQIVLTDTFTALKSGVHSINVIVDVNVSATIGGRYGIGQLNGITTYNAEHTDYLGFAIIVTDSLSNVVGTESSGGHGHMYWQDFVFTTFPNLVAGETYTYTLLYYYWSDLFTTPAQATISVEADTLI